MKLESGGFFLANTGSLGVEAPTGSGPSHWGV